MITPYEWRQQFAEWIERFQWDWFVTLTFRPGITPPKARRHLEHWIHEVRDQLGTEKFSSMAVPESGVTGLNFHYHAVIGGLRQGHGATERLDFMCLWHRMSGDAQVTAFKPGSGGILYILKDLGPNDTAAIMLDLPAETATLQSDSIQKCDS
jgi:hypothetical protein